MIDTRAKQLILGLALVILASATAGCTRHLNATPSLDYPGTTPLPLAAALVIDPGLAAREDRFGSYWTMGIANTWVNDTGDGLPPALEQMTRSVFRDVRVVSRVEDAQGVDVLLVPGVVELRQMEERSGFWVSFKLRAIARDRAGEIRLDEVYHEQDEGSTAAAVWGGAFAAAAALTVPTERAMARALARLRDDLLLVPWQANAP